MKFPTSAVGGTTRDEKWSVSVAHAFFPSEIALRSLKSPRRDTLDTDGPLAMSYSDSENFYELE